MSDFSVPHHFRPGALPRRTRFGHLERVPPLADVMPIHDEADWPELLRTHQPLKVYIPPCYGYESTDGIYDQDGVGSCASESSDQGLSLIRVQHGQEWVLFNPWGQYHFVSGGVDRGSTLDDNVRHLMTVGAFPEEVWPRSKGWQRRPDSKAIEVAYYYRLTEVFDVENRQQCISALLSGFAVYYGSDGHAKLFVGLEDLETGIYANSWASSWGERGYGYERFSNVNFMYGCFAFREATRSKPMLDMIGG